MTEDVLIQIESVQKGSKTLTGRLVFRKFNDTQKFSSGPSLDDDLGLEAKLKFSLFHQLNRFVALLKNDLEEEMVPEFNEIESLSI